MVTLDLFRDAFEVREVRAGDPIFHEGEEGKQMYVLLEGFVKLSIMGRQVEKVERGGVFGEMALIDSAPRSASAVAITACKVVPVTGERFRSLCREYPQFALEIMGIMARRLRSMDQRV